MSRSKAQSIGKRVVMQTPDGIEIISREHNMLGPHPRASIKQMVQISGVNKILLADERVMAECDACGYYHDNERSVRGHMPSHNAARTEPDTPISVIRKVVSIANKYRRIQSRTWAKLVAHELNELGVKSAHKKPWSDHMVRALYAKWSDDPRIKTVRTSTSRKIDVPGSHARPAQQLLSSRGQDNMHASITLRLETLADRLGTMAGVVRDLCMEMQALPLAASDYDELKAKAQKYDELTRLLQR